MALSQTGANYDHRSQIPDGPIKKALDDLASRISHVGVQVVAGTFGVTPAPPRISSLSVTAANGIYDIAIQDNNPVQRGIEYFLEYSLTANFAQPTVIHLGATRNERRYLGNLTLYWRGYSQYPTSPPSPVVYFGSASAPTPVVGGGSAGPAPQPSNGSGTAPGNGLSGGQGYGSQPNRGGGGGPKQNIL